MELRIVDAMKAVVISAVNQLSVADVTAPRPAAGEALVAIHAAALNHRDVWIKTGQYAGLTYPCIPGSDGTGVVSAVADGADSAWIGREVIINPSFGWGGSPAAQGEEFSILGLPRQGTLAASVAVPIGQLTPKPEHLGWKDAAALPLAGLTAYRALFTRGGLKSGERVLITGIGGGVALFTLQFAVAAGAEVWVTSSSPEKIEQAVSLGAKGGFNYTEKTWTALALKTPGMFEVIVDSAGGEGFDGLIDVAAPGGRIVFFGATRGNPAGLAMRKIFWRQLSLLGTTMGSPDDWAAMVEFVNSRKIKPVVSTLLPLEHADEAFALMERGAQFGKIVLTTSA
jgi:NADPH:quinone reductase-like Zn-dependent oxidoreductase